jgi:hypothetical protein
MMEAFSQLFPSIRFAPAWWIDPGLGLASSNAGLPRLLAERLKPGRLASVIRARL